MSIFHHHVKSIKRSAGHSSVAAKAYRSAARLMDERTGRVHDYSRKRGVVHSEMVHPSGPMPNWAKSSAQLWNEAERKENRKNSQTAREIELALPCELTAAQRIALTRGYAEWLVQKYGTIVDYDIHEPVLETAEMAADPVPLNNGLPGNDPRNHHVHMMMTTRAVTADGWGDKTRALDCKPQSSAEVEEMREEWAKQVNHSLERAGYDQSHFVDHRSYERQGRDVTPTQHLGPAVIDMAQNGVETDKAEQWQADKSANVIDLETERKARREQDVQYQVQQDLKWTADMAAMKEFQAQQLQTHASYEVQWRGQTVFEADDPSQRMTEKQARAVLQPERAEAAAEYRQLSQTAAELKHELKQKNWFSKLFAGDLKEQIAETEQQVAEVRQDIKKMDRDWHQQPANPQLHAAKHGLLSRCNEARDEAKDRVRNQLKQKQMLDEAKRYRELNERMQVLLTWDRHWYEEPPAPEPEEEEQQQQVEFSREAEFDLPPSMPKIDMLEQAVGVVEAEVLEMPEFQAQVEQMVEQVSEAVQKVAGPSLGMGM